MVSTNSSLSLSESEGRWEIFPVEGRSKSAKREAALLFLRLTRLLTLLHVESLMFLASLLEKIFGRIFSLQAKVSESTIS